MLLSLIEVRGQIDALAAAAAHFRQADCALMPTITAPGTAWRLMVRLPVPPPELSEAAGRVLHSLRSALDDLVSCLTEPCRPAAFPICSDPRAFVEAINAHRLAGVPLAAQVVLAALQPYPGRNQGLALLQELHDRSQERALELSLVVAGDVRLQWKRAGILIYESLLPECEAQNERLLGEEASRGLALPTDLDVRGTAVTYLTFTSDLVPPSPQPLTVVNTLNQLTDYVSGTVVPALEQFL